MEALQTSQLETYSLIRKLQENFKKSPKERVTRAYLDTRLEILESYWAKFQKVHDSLVVAPADTKLTLSYFVNNTSDDCMETYLELKTMIKEKFNILCDKEKPTTRRENPTNQNVQTGQSPICKVKLPPIQIPRFSGEYKDWNSFHDLFKSLINDNETLSDVNKCQYLKSSLQGEAENLVKQIPVTEASYEIMWETLKRRYNNRRHIVNSFLGRLLNQRKITNETPKLIRELLDVTSECLTSLKAINIPTDNWDDIIVYIVIQKLDTESHRLFEQRIETLDRLPTWKDLSDFLELRFRTLETVKGRDIQTSHRNANTAKSFATTTSGTSAMNCVYCNADHKIYSCQKFNQLEVNERQQYIQKNRLCFNCLKKGHSVIECTLSNCRKCGRKHHTLLHGYSVPAGPSPTTTPTQSSQTQQIVNTATVENIEKSNDNIQKSFIDSKDIDNINSITMKTSIDASSVILATALVAVQSHRNHNIHTLRALVDQGSQASLITEGACQELGLKKAPIQGNIVGVSANNTVTKALVEFEIMSRHNPNMKVKVIAYVLKTLTSYIPQRVNAIDWPQLNSLQLADHTFTQPGRVDILLGAEIFADIIKKGVLVQRNEKSSLVAQETSLGWLISGNSLKLTSKQTTVCAHHTRIEIDSALRRFWELEEPGTEKRIMTNTERKCEQHFKTTHKRNISGRYEVQIPFTNSPPDLGESESIALKRLAAVERKFKILPSLHNRYLEFMQDYLDQAHMEPVSQTSKPNNSTCYLPHHAVINEQHLTTKLRVVFDASAKTSNGKSLNDNILIGPTLQNDIRDTTLRWRRHATVLVGDIRQMYRQIQIEENNRDFQRIVWRWKLNEPVQHYRLTTVTYGTSCAPYLAIKILKQLATDEKGNFPEEVINALSSDFYVDDLLTGAPTVGKAIELKNRLTKLLSKGGFELHKWASNCPEIESLTQGKRKVLGINWNNESDKFELNFELRELDENDTQPTKRSILQDVAKLYDPAGWLAPIVVKAKVFLQRLWEQSLDWDDEIPEAIEAEWLTFRKNLCSMPTIELDRWIGMTDDLVSVELHGFSDASDMAYSAVVYCRTILPDTIKVTLIEAKTKVAPLKKISTPRLELCGAVLLANLMDRIKNALNIPDKDIHAWTDATIVLAWLQRPSNYWNTFVANRVTEITNKIDPGRWHHVASQDNPADVASRGICPLELQSHELWWNGPPWLREHREIPVTDISEIVNPTEEEKRSQVKVQCSVLVPDSNNKIDIINRYSNLNKLIRVTSYCLRFIYKCKCKAKKNSLTEYNTHLSSKEMQDALSRLIRMSQESESIDGKNIKNLNSFIDDDNILKVGGRIQNAYCSRETKHPVILAKNSRLAYLIVKEAHFKTLHGGVQLMLNHVRNKFHIIGVKHVIKKVIKKCIACSRNSNRPVNQLMGNLPKDRVTPQRPFLVSGVDFAGPIILKLHSGRRSNTTQKAYIALFICSVTKAVHIELVTSLSTEGFLAAFRRFTARRGHCKKLLSDCGTNFIGASKELEILVNKCLSNVPIEIAELLAQDGTEWQFNPAGAPHMGGLWEANIKSIKRHLNRVLGDSKLTYEEYSTLLCQIESCLNSRPLTSLEDEKDGTTVALTPGHFLIGENPIVVPDENLSDSYIPYNKRWIYLQKNLQSFWRQWSQEYLVNLQKRQKWTSIQSNLKVGDVVLIKDERLPPTKWLMGKITIVHPGADGLVRVVSLKCKNTVVKRPIHKLCLLPTDNEFEDVSL